MHTAVFSQQCALLLSFLHPPLCFVFCVVRRQLTHICALASFAVLSLMRTHLHGFGLVVTLHALTDTAVAMCSLCDHLLQISGRATPTFFTCALLFTQYTHYTHMNTHAHTHTHAHTRTYMHRICTALHQHCPRCQTD